MSVVVYQQMHKVVCWSYNNFNDLDEILLLDLQLTNPEFRSKCMYVLGE
jgi:hypothetical protein